LQKNVAVHLNVQMQLARCTIKKIGHHWFN
jgi:hypothetical protein